MIKSNAARDIIWPTDTDVLVRVVVLYVGQGACAIVLAADGNGCKSMVVDINLDKENGGIDVPALVQDLVGEDGLDVFVNTHPHDDHLCGVKVLSDKVSIGEIWHSGHVPSKKHGACYEELMEVIKNVKQNGGKERILEGSRGEQSFGEANYYVLAPAEYVTDEVNEEKADERYRRIHEQCAVLKFGVGAAWAMVPGDADRAAFEKHITRYHKQRLGAQFLAASHHGSRTFFRCNKEDEPYRDALNAIDPEYVVVSAPKQKESPHDHPHNDAMEEYRKKAGSENVLHTGEQRYSFICDIFRDGTYSGVMDDKGKLAESYPIDDEDDRKTKRSETDRAFAVIPAVRTRIDDRPMGSR